jgi:pSer/pThr/pTyr-binding forkhead associated (FHA) protein
MSFRLIPLIRGSAPVIVLQRPVLLIGRHLECDVRINSPKVSRRHCCLAMAYDRVLIRDLGSRNGVRVNGRSVDESRLYGGDELAIGPIIFRLETSRAGDRASSPVVATRFGDRPGPVGRRLISLWPLESSRDVTITPAQAARKSISPCSYGLGIPVV